MDGSIDRHFPLDKSAFTARAFFHELSGNANRYGAAIRSPFANRRLPIERKGTLSNGTDCRHIPRVDLDALAHCAVSERVHVEVGAFYTSL